MFRVEFQVMRCEDEQLEVMQCEAGGFEDERREVVRCEDEQHENKYLLDFQQILLQELEKQQ